MDDGVTIILDWDEVDPLYLVNVTVTSETKVNISQSTAQLTVACSCMYNVSVMISHLCDQSGMTIFSEVYYYPCTSARECSVHFLVYQN